jgi:hypothetical protein
MDRGVTLARYLEAEAGRRFELGTADCVTLAADWVRGRLGVDPLAHCRDGYHGNREADALLAGWGGLLRVAGRAMARAGVPLTRAAEPGDVAVIAFGGFATCAIRTGRGWMLRIDDGMAMLPPDRVRVLAAWRV